MPRYVIERNVPGAGRLSEKDLFSFAQKSCTMLDALVGQVQWVESFVTENKVYCIYQSPNKAMLMQHASTSGLPANRIEEISVVINPVTAEKQ
ncbi:MAG TPA: DUF4242 domain-containing protein [Flavisolibacter sp.]|nr:DUF4242 domain-containing protein [Flavisolibacter sp.]